jgi:hypothetical protein
VYEALMECKAKKQRHIKSLQGKKEDEDVEMLFLRSKTAPRSCFL